MAFKEITFLIGNGEFFPTLYVKIDKQNTTFLYCVVLYILVDGETKEVCHYDNYHGKGHHIHYLKLNGEEDKQEKSELESIGNIIDYLNSNWKTLKEQMKNE